MNEAEYLMKNYGDRGGCYPPRPTASTNNTLLWLFKHWLALSTGYITLQQVRISKSEEVDLLFAKSKKRKHYILVYASTLAKSSICDRKFSYFYISYRKRTWLNSVLFTTIPTNSEKNDAHTWIILIAPIM